MPELSNKNAIALLLDINQDIEDMDAKRDENVFYGRNCC